MSAQGQPEFEHEPRRSYNRLSDEELEAIAQRAAEIVSDQFTLAVGKVAIKLVLYVCGAIVIAVLGWLGLSGRLKP